MIYKYQRIFIIVGYVFLILAIVNITERGYISSRAVAATTVQTDIARSEKQLRNQVITTKQLTPAQLLSVLKDAGFKGNNLREAWAIAMRESNGRPNAFNGDLSTGDQSYGIFQINMIGDLGPDRRDRYDLEKNSDLFNPYLNAEIAYKMSRGGEDWSSWKGLTPRAMEFYKDYPNYFDK